MNLSNFGRKRLIILSVVVAIIFIVLVIFTVQKLIQNPYGSAVEIQGYDKKIKNLPKEYKDSLTALLYQVIKRNSSDDKIPTITSIGDANIREGSEKQDQITQGVQYSGSFIVDIESIRQSYFVQYAYSKDPEDGFGSGYPLLVSCLPKDKLIYGEFNCKDATSQENASSDPIFGLLPYESSKYSIKAIKADDGQITLKVKLYITDSDKSIGLESAVALAKQNVIDWIISQGINPSNYIIEYTY